MTIGLLKIIINWCRRWKLRNKKIIHSWNRGIKRGGILRSRLETSSLYRWKKIKRKSYKNKMNRKNLKKGSKMMWNSRGKKHSSQVQWKEKSWGRLKRFCSNKCRKGGKKCWHKTTWTHWRKYLTRTSCKEWKQEYKLSSPDLIDN